AAVDPASISRPTCFVAVEFPNSFGDAAVDTYVPLVLAGSVSATDSTISWRLASQTQSFLSQLILSPITQPGGLPRLTVKGRFIWSRNDPTLFLDGEAFGQSSAGNGSSVALRLPSGDRRLGGDFEMWFWLVGAPSFITDIQVSPSTEIIVGDTVTV